MAVWFLILLSFVLLVYVIYRLFYLGQPVKAEKNDGNGNEVDTVMKDYNIRNQSTLNLMKRMKGGF